MAVEALPNRFPAGSLVHVRGRDWVVLSSQEQDVLRLRPLTGGEDQITGIYLPVEGRDIKPASFDPPDPRLAGDTTGGTLLCDAARLSLRSGATPFRSLGRISVVPRPYQFVPLIMALRLDPVRLLIADDVGVGKTIEAGMIAREMLDRGIARRLAVLCPAHLCDQWERELREKFAIEAAVIQPSRLARLERNLPRQDISVYQYYPHLIASIDFVKAGRNRDPFLHNAPDLIIVDEAHSVERPRGETQRAEHQRYEFVRELASDPNRHVLLVTATPHSGIEESFRSLLGLINPSFDVDPANPTAALDRRQLVPHIVQRRRDDLKDWLGTETPFPERDPEEITYPLAPAYQSLFQDVLDYCRETIRAGVGGRTPQQRVRHWAAIALLRCVLSSPEAAVAVLSERARKQGLTELPETVGDVDDAYAPQVLDPLADENLGDYVPSAPIQDADPYLTDPERRHLASFLQRARALAGPDSDHKLAKAAESLRKMLREGFHPIVFCRFIATANYLQAQLQALLAKDSPGIRVAAVTGEIGDEERREKIEELRRDQWRVLVATDCLSEGINLQEHFDAVLHYDLPWNPNRLEQREGRVDRFGQLKSKVKAVLLYGSDNPVDLVVLDVLIRKAQTIRRRLGVSVPVPVESDQVVQAVVDSVLLRGREQGVQLQFAFEDPEVSRFHSEWDAAAEREGTQRAYFRQHTIKPDEVAQEIHAIDPVLGDPATVQSFVANAAQRFGGELRQTGKDGVFELSPGSLHGLLSNRNGHKFPARVTFDRLKDPGALFLGRTQPIVSAFCDAVLGASLSQDSNDLFARSGAMFTTAVEMRTGVALLRLRYLLREKIDEFAEEVLLAPFERQQGKVVWLRPIETRGRELLEQATSQSVGTMSRVERMEQVEWALGFLAGQDDWYAPVVESRVQQLQESHARLRKMVKASRLEIRPHTPPDILGCYVLMPVGGGR